MMNLNPASTFWNYSKMKTSWMYYGWLGNRKIPLVAQTILWLGLNLGLHAQNRFNTISLFGNNENTVVVNDTGYVTLQQGNYQPEESYITFHHFNKSGALLKIDSIDLGSFFEDCRNCLEVFKNGYLKGGTFFYSPQSSAVALLKLKPNLDTAEVKTYSYADTAFSASDLFGLKVFGDNEILLLGTHYNPSGGTFNLLVARLDSNLIVRWDTIYNRLGWNGVGGWHGYDAVKTQDGGYLIGGIANRFLNQPSAGILLKIDSLGAEQWRKELTGPEGNMEVLLQNGNNGNIDFLTVQRQNEVAPDQYYSRLRMGEISQSGQILKDSLIGPTILNPTTAFFEKTPDGNYLTGGYAQNLNWGSYSFKFKPNGDSIWFRQYFYGTNYFQDEGFIESMAFTPDSGMVFCGYFFNSDGANTWLIKADKYGCDTAGCHSVGLHEPPYSGSKFSVFPNPAQSKVIVQWQSAAPLRDIHFTLRDAQGKKLRHIEVQDYQKNQQVLDLSSLKPGLYLLEVRENEKQLDVLRVVKK